jgi:hypothetical protein
MTNGPWMVDEIGTSNNGEIICEVVTESRGAMVASHMYLEDARLIAAAPELLTLAKEYLEFLFSEWHAFMSQAEFDSNDTVARVRAAINKAQGASEALSDAVSKKGTTE